MLGACARREQATTTTTAGGAKPSKTAKVEKTGTDVGAILPDYTAKHLDDSPFDIKDERGKVVLLNLWATWCGPCRLEVPELQTLHERYGARGFEVIGVSVDESGADVVKTFVDENKLSYPIVLDPDGKLASVFNTQVLPTTVLLDREGRIVWRKFGLIETNNAELKQAIEKAL